MINPVLPNPAVPRPVNMATQHGVFVPREQFDGLAKSVESLGAIMAQELKEGLNRGDRNEIARVSKQLSESGGFDRLTNAVSGVLSSLTGICNTAQEDWGRILGTDRNVALEFVAEVVNQGIKLIRSNPLLELFLNQVKSPPLSTRLVSPATASKIRNMDIGTALAP